MAANPVSFDDVLIDVGIGRFQMVIFVTNVMFQLLLPFCTQAIIFLGATPEHFCSVFSHENNTTKVPLKSLGNTNFNQNLYRCWQFNESFEAKEMIICQDGWTYSNEVYGETIVTEWDLVCSKENVAALTQSIMMLAGSFGSVCFGRLADHYGRSRVIRSTLLAFILAGVAIAFSPNIYVFSVLFTIIGFTHPGYWVTIQVLLLEYLPTHYRSVISAWPSFFQSIGSILLGLIAMFVRDWRYLQLTLMTLPVMTLPIVWLIPESARWCLSKGKIKEAERIVHVIAKLNKKETIGPLLSKTSNITRGSESQETSADYSETLMCSKGNDNFDHGNLRNLPKMNYEETLPKYKVLDILRPPVLTITFVVCFVNVIYSLVYFGFVLNTGNLAGNPFVNFILGGIVEIPARLIPALIIKRLGGRLLAILFYTLSGATLIVIIFIPPETNNGTDFIGTISILSLVGRFFITAVNTSVLVLSMELFPTPVRALGNGIANFFGRLGGVIAPLLLLTDRLLPGFATIMMAISSMLAAFLVYLLPETLNQPQLETISELKNLMHQKRRLCPTPAENRI